MAEVMYGCYSKTTHRGRQLNTKESENLLMQRRQAEDECGGLLLS
jgi:hypothetical protein